MIWVASVLSNPIFLLRADLVKQVSLEVFLMISELGEKSQIARWIFDVSFQALPVNRFNEIVANLDEKLVGLVLEDLKLFVLD